MRMSRTVPQGKKKNEARAAKPEAQPGRRVCHRRDGSAPISMRDGSGERRTAIDLGGKHSTPCVANDLVGPPPLQLVFMWHSVLIALLQLGQQFRKCDAVRAQVSVIAELDGWHQVAELQRQMS